MSDDSNSDIEIEQSQSEQICITDEICITGWYDGQFTNTLRIGSGFGSSAELVEAISTVNDGDHDDRIPGYAYELIRGAEAIQVFVKVGYVELDL